MSPVGGQATTQEAEDLIAIQLQAAAAANGNGINGDLTGYAGGATLEVVNTGSGTCTLTLQGSFDGVNWYAVGYMQVDAVANPVRSVAALATGASPSTHVYSVLDTYNLYRAVISATAGALALTATLRGFPV
jgi:hypothetical protein